MEKEAWIRPRMLIVDDDEELLSILAAYFHEHFYDVVTARNAEEAYHLAEHRDVDVVVLDESLPDQMGRLVLPTIKALAGAPVVMISSAADPAVENDSRMLGAAAFFAKPFSPTQLAAQVHELLPEIAQ
jgi:DNA-binding response OmpR family regulator